MDDAWAEISYQYEDVDQIDGFWNLLEDFSVNDAAALVAGYCPTRVSECRNDTFFNKAFPRYEIALKGICNAILKGRLKAYIRYSAREYGYADHLADMEYSEAVGFVYETDTTAKEDEVVSADQTCFYKPFPDWSLTTVSRDDLVEWLKSRNINTGFFFETATNVTDYLDRNHPYYAPKLAAAIRAWQAVTSDPRYLNNGKHVKQNLESWLTAHAAEFDLVKPDGEINTDAIKNQIAKVANWKDKGGAPKTPGE